MIIAKAMKDITVSKQTSAWMVKAGDAIAVQIGMNDKNAKFSEIIAAHAPDCEALAEALNKARAWVHQFSPTCNQDVSPNDCTTMACAGLRDTIDAYRAGHPKG